MEISVAFVDCPGYMDQHGAARCGLPAVVEDRYTMTSTDGPLESARIRCPRGHYFNGPVESLTWEKGPRGYGFTGSAGAAESSRR
jgi:hypothetical protein